MAIRLRPTHRRFRGRLPAALKPRFERLEDRALLAGTFSGIPNWVEQGPGPILGGQTEGMGLNPVAGAIQAIAPDPANADRVFVGTVNGGVWRTNNATGENPNWEPLTDQFPSLSIGAVAISPTDLKVVYAGINTNISSFGGLGSPGAGVLKSTDNGDNWRLLGAGTFAGLDIRSLVPTSLSSGQVILAGTSGGIFRSTDGGVTWSQRTTSNTTHLVADPGNPSRFYAGAPTLGVFRSTDGGLTWTAVNGSGSGQTLTNIGTTTRIEISVGAGGVVFAALIDRFSPTQAMIFRSTDQGGTWRSMGQPGSREAVAPDPNRLFDGIDNDRDGITDNPIDDFDESFLDFFGLNPGGQTGRHFSILASNTDDNVVFVGGDRQPAIPSSAGTHHWSGRLLRGDFRRSFFSQWEPIVGNGADPDDYRGCTITAVVPPLPPGPMILTNGPKPGTSPHADSREMVFDPNGNILQSDDGGIYRLVNPNNDFTCPGVFVITDPSTLPPRRHWESVNGNIRPAEINSIAYDRRNRVLLAGMQDVGTSEQTSSNSTTWDTARVLFDLIRAVGDGNTQVIDPTGPNVIRYSMGNDYGVFIRREFDNSNAQVGPATPIPLRAPFDPRPLSGLQAADQNLGIATIPYVLNAVQPSRLLTGFNGLYESFDRGDTVGEITPAGMTGVVTALAYGGRELGADNPEVAYVGTTSGQLWVRTERFAGPGTFTLLTSYPGGAVRDIAIDPDDWRTVYVVDAMNVYRGFIGPSSTSWTNLTGNLGQMSNDLRTITLYKPTFDPGDITPVVGGAGGVYRTLNPFAGAGVIWTEFGRNLPNAIVRDLHYEFADRTLVAATHGRGAWTVPDADLYIRTPAVFQIDDNSTNSEFTLSSDPDNPTLIRIVTNGSDIVKAPKSVLGQVVINGGDGCDRLTIDLTSGAVLFPWTTLTFNGDSENCPAGDEVVFNGGVGANAVYRPDRTTTGRGRVEFDDRFYDFGGVERVTVTNMQCVTLTTRGSLDDLTVDSPAADRNRISGSSAGVAIAPLAFLDVQHVILNAASNDSGSGDTVTINDAGLIARGLQSFDILTGAGNDQIRVHRATPGKTLTLSGGGDDDTFELGSPTSGVVSILGPVVISSEPGADTLVLDDRAAPYPLTYTISNAGVSGDLWGPMTYGGVERLTLNAGRGIHASGATEFVVHSTAFGVTTTINAGDGDDTINVSPTAGSLAALQGELIVNGEGNSDTLNLHDQSNPFPFSYNIESTQLSGFGVPTLRYGSMENVVLNSGGGLFGNATSSFFVGSTAGGTPVTIFAGGGNDSVTVGGGDLDFLLAPVTVNGESGTDSVVLNDSNSGNVDNFVITDSSVAKQPFELTFATVEAVTVEAAPFDNFFQINSTGAPPVSINGGLGNDTFSFADGGRIGGRLDGQDGSDTLDYTLYRTAAEVNRVAGTATGIGGGYANIENILGATIVSAFDVLDRKLATGQLNGMFEAESLLGYASGDARIASETFAGLGVIDFIDPQNAGSFGHFAVNNPFPNNTPADNDDFAVKITAVVQFPSAGFWTFGTHSDDGLRLKIDSSLVIDDPLPHAPEDKYFSNFYSAGYHTLELAFFERGGGATLELFAAPGFHSSFNENFRLVGDVANGGLNVFATTGLSVRDVKRAGGTVTSIADADALLALRPGDPGIASERSAILPTIDFFDTEGGGGTGHYNLNRPFPNNSPLADDHFAVRADAFIYIPATSDWTFATNSDDGVRLRIDGNTVLDAPLPQGPTDHLRVVELTRGFHALNLTYFEQGGGAEVELFAAQHINLGFSSAFRLVGDTANGGLLALAASNCLTVTHTLDGGPGSLRDAIGCANVLPGHDTITFAITGAGIHTIRPQSALPPIADTTTLDGYSQPGARPNSLYSGTDAILTVELDGTSAGPGANGLTLAASDSAIRGLVINRFSQHGIEVAYSNRNVIQGNYIGTDTTGSLDLGNGGNGIAITAPAFLNAQQNRVGGPFPADRNVVSGNAGDGVIVFGNGATGNLIQGNFIGTDATGARALGNSSDGVELGFAYGTVIGTGLLAGRNVISGNAGDGIRINGGSGPLAQPVSRWRGDGNAFDASGSNHGTVLGSAGYLTGQVNQAFNLDGIDDAIEIPDSPTHTTTALTLEAWVRPDTLGIHRTIASKYDSRFTSGNSWALQATPDGKVEFAAYQTYIANGPAVFRHIRTVEPVLMAGTWRHVAASYDVATQQMEIYIDGARAASTLMPGSQPLASIVDSNTPMRLGAIFASGSFVGLTQFWDGLLDEVGLYNRALSASEVQALYRRNVGGHQITANYIGADATGTSPLGNAGDGISIINSTGNMIGGMLPLFSNTIAHNGGVGVVVESGAGNAILTNRVYSNAVLGIDLASNMVTPNDPMDADGGANTLQNFPDVRSAVIKPNRLDVSGIMSGRASQPYTLQFFASATCDPSGNGQGATVIGTAEVTTSAAGSSPFAASIPIFGPIARFITATATDAVGNTSEFSTCHGAVPEIAGDINADGAANLLDIVIQQGRLGQATSQGVFGGDLDGDGLVSRSDVARLVQSYGSSAQPPGPIAADAAIAQLWDRDHGANRRLLRSRRAVPAATSTTSTEMPASPTLTAQRVSSKLRSQRLVRS